MKKYIIIAGVNGAGKSTLYQTIESLKGMPRVNVDEIVREIGDWKNVADVFHFCFTFKTGRCSNRTSIRYHMNAELTELVFILDRSGSMNGLESDTIGGFNGMISR